MRLALIFNPGCRVGIGERCAGVLRNFPGITFECFDVRAAASLRGGFDLYLRLDDGDYALGGLDHLHPLAWWVADTHLKHSFNNIVINARATDFLFCFQKEGSERLARLLDRRVFWLPAAADYIVPPLSFVPFAQRRRDIAFVGTTGKFSLRKVALELVRSEYPDSFVGTAPREELPGIYAQSRLTVNYSINNDINMRTFEAMGAGALVVTSRIRNNGFEELFTSGENCLVFDDITTGELKTVIDRALSALQESESIARAGWELVNARHTWFHRMQMLLRIAGGYK